jgi:hypothetical protein
MKIIRSLVIIFLSIFVFHSTIVFAQQLNCQVKVEMPRLLPRDQEDLSDLAQKLTNYLNNTSWSDANRDIILDCNIQLIIETVTNRGADKIHRAQFLINSSSGENFYDRSCEFVYFPGHAFENYRTSFDPLLDLVDYYAYMVIAGELDTYEMLSGSPFYDKAQDIANQGQLSNYSAGWKNRLDEVVSITDVDHVQLREAKFYYYEGLYFVEKEPNPQYVKQFAKAVIDRLSDIHNKQPNSKALKRFFDSHFQEICLLFQYDEDKSNLTTMENIDARHRDTYEKCETQSLLD